MEIEIIDKPTVLDRLLKELAGIVERAAGDLRPNLDSYNQEKERDHRQGTIHCGFLSSLREESKMSASDIKIKVLKENNNDLTQIRIEQQNQISNGSSRAT